MKEPRSIDTRRGPIPLPAYIPVTTFGKKYPLDDLVRPYLPRLAPAVMVSHFYAQQMIDRPTIPMLVDSGGFASLFERNSVVSRKGLGLLQVVNEEGEKQVTHPREVLEFQEQVADVAFTLDFPIPPDMGIREAKRRYRLTLANAEWAIDNRRRSDLPLFACVQAWDVASAREAARRYAESSFDGIAIGGLIPRVRDMETIEGVVKAVRDELPDLPLHVFGLGKPAVVTKLMKWGVDSVDSSSYVKLAASGRLWSDSKVRVASPTPTDRLHLALCNLAHAANTAMPLAAATRFTTTSLGPVARQQAMLEKT